MFILLVTIFSSLITLLMFMALGFWAGLHSRVVFKQSLDSWVESEMVKLNTEIQRILSETDKFCHEKVQDTEEQCHNMLQEAQVDVLLAHKHVHNILDNKEAN